MGKKQYAVIDIGSCEILSDWVDTREEAEAIAAECEQHESAPDCKIISHEVTMSMTTYIYTTDSETGTLLAANWGQAKRKLVAMMTPTQLANGAWGWVEDTDGERFRHGDADKYEPTHYGDLHDYVTGDYIRLATFREAQSSAAAGPEGVILVNGHLCYVDV